jgi:CMP-N,N'-diacetyllegionaminic acid synthase
MLKGKKILAIIPARGGSKGVPGKNIKILAGSPLITYTIEQALKSRYLDKAIVSTDDPEIKRVSIASGIEVIDRPPEYAKDTSPIIDAIKQVIDALKRKEHSFDIIALLEPTSPLRKDDDIDKAIEKFIKNWDNADALVSMGEIALENPHIAKVIRNGMVAPFIEMEKKAYRRQDLEKAFFPYGVIYMSKTEKLLETGTFYQEKTIPYLIERWQNYEVDDIYDFIAIDAIIKYKRTQK